MTNIIQRSILSVLVINFVYFTFFYSLFFLFKNFTLSKGMNRIGVFFTVQMGVMVVLRLMTGRLFDLLDKRVLVFLALVVTGCGFIMLYFMEDASSFIPAAIIFGPGMVVCAPRVEYTGSSGQ